MSVQSEIERISNNVQSTLNTIAETGVEVGQGSDALPAAAAALANEKAPINHTHDYSELSGKPSIPTKTSELDNDSGYLTQHQSLEGYAKTEDLPENLSDLGEDADHRTVTDTEKASWDAKSEFSGKYEDLSGKPTIPTQTSQLTNDSGFLTAHQDLSEYAKKTELPTKLSDLTADAEHRTVTDTEKAEWSGKSNFSGSYNDLTDKPTLFSGSYNDLSDKPTIPTALSDLTDDASHRTVTDTEKNTWSAKSDFSGSYNDLSDVPTSFNPATHSHPASKITKGTFAGQVIANASTQDPGVSIVRNTKLVAAEATPTVNGEIFWVYG